MTFFRIFTACAVVGLVAVMSPQTASAGAALVPASQAAIGAPDRTDIVKVAELWRGNGRLNRGRFGGNWHKRAHRHEWRERAYRHKWRNRRHSHRRYHRRGSDFGFALGATGLFLGLSALAARPYYNGYDGYSGYSGYSGTASGSCSRYEPWSTPWYRCCSAKYRTFDPRTGTYHAYSGRDRFCR